MLYSGTQEMDRSHFLPWVEDLGEGLASHELAELRALILADLKRERGFNSRVFAEKHLGDRIIGRAHHECGEDAAETLYLLGNIAGDVAVQDPEKWQLVEQEKAETIICSFDLYREFIGAHVANVPKSVLDVIQKHQTEQARTAAEFSAATGIGASNELYFRMLGHYEDIFKGAMAMGSGISEGAISEFRKEYRESGESDRRDLLLSMIFSFRNQSTSLLPPILEGLDNRSFRLMLLSFATSRTKPHSRKCLGYLRRLSKAFLLGLDAECILWCRSAMEHEFKSHIALDDLQSRFGKAGVGKERLSFTLEEYIQLARENGVLSKELALMADEVRRKANEVVHDKPHGEKDAGKVIANCLTIISELNS